MTVSNEVDLGRGVTVCRDGGKVVLFRRKVLVGAPADVRGPATDKIVLDPAAQVKLVEFFERIVDSR